MSRMQAPWKALITPLLWAQQRGWPLEAVVGELSQDPALKAAERQAYQQAAEALAQGQTLPQVLLSCDGLGCPKATAQWLAQVATQEGLAQALRLLDQDAELEAQEAQMHRRLMTWPAAVLTVFGATTLLISVFVMPAMDNVHQGVQASLPWVSQSLLYGGVVVGALALLLGFALFLSLTGRLWAAGRRGLAWAGERLAKVWPALARVQAAKAQWQLWRCLSVTPAEPAAQQAAMLQVASVATATASRRRAEAMAQALGSGQTLADAWRDHAGDLASPSVLWGLAERMGATAEAAQHFAQQSELALSAAQQQFEDQTVLFSRLLAAVGVAWLLMATYLPIFAMGALP
ncbi:MAG: type II secretion system F family protein [Ideonella sp.]|nr:type II secretion system F family protein [Ideonella sp.]